MYEAQHLLDLQDNNNNNGGFVGGGDPNSWLSAGEDHSLSPATAPTTTATASNVDRVLFKDLVEIVPLVQSLIDRKPNASFTRRGSMIYTKTPSRESLYKKTSEPKGKNATQSIPTKKQRDYGDKDQAKNVGNKQDGGTERFSMLSSRSLPAEKEREELNALKEQVEDLQKKLSEKDEILKSAEMSKIQMNTINEKLDELRKQVVDKDSLIKSTQLQLSDAKIKLADKQAAVEKLQWESMTSNKEVERLQEDLDSMRGEISSLMLVFDGLSKNDCHVPVGDYDIAPHLDHLPPIDDLEETELQKMEEARQFYVDAVAAAKEMQDEDSIAIATNARLRLQSFIFRKTGVSS